MSDATIAHPADLLLVEQALGGSVEARAEVIRRLSSIPRMLRSRNFKLGRPLNEHDLQDLEQDVLITVWRRLGLYNGTGGLDAYVYRISFDLYLNRLRRKRRGLAKDIDESEADHSVDPSARIESLARHEGVTRALDTLDPEEREVVVLRTMEDLPFEDVAAKLEIPIGAAKDRYCRARSALRAFFEGRREGAPIDDTST